MFIPVSGSVSTLMPWLLTFVIGIVSCTPLMTAGWGTLRLRYNLNALEILLCVLGFVLCLSSLVTETYNPFLYFRF